MPEEITRKELGEKYIKNCVGTEYEVLVPKIVSGGEEETLDFYLGAEKITMKTIQTLLDLGLQTDSPEIKVWSAILGYISHKISTLLKEKS